MAARRIIVEQPRRSLSDPVPVTRVVTHRRPVTRIVTEQRPVTRVVTEERPATRIVTEERPVARFVSEERPVARIVTEERPVTQVIASDGPVTRIVRSTEADTIVRRERVELAPPRESAIVTESTSVQTDKDALDYWTHRMAPAIADVLPSSNHTFVPKSVKVEREEFYRDEPADSGLTNPRRVLVRRKRVIMYGTVERAR